VFVTTIADAIDTGLPGPELFARACDAARGSLVEDTLQAASSALPVSDGENMGWVRIALQHAFFHLRNTTNFEAGLIQTAVKGGDSDTNGAITGALLGAVLGESAIPVRWRQAVLRCASPRPAEYRCSDLSQLAAELLAHGSGSFTH
jgi:ADP-ribosylglycohydrolase